MYFWLQIFWHRKLIWIYKLHLRKNNQQVCLKVLVWCVNSFSQIYNSRMQSFVVNMVIGIESILSRPQRRPHRVHPPGGLKWCQVPAGVHQTVARGSDLFDRSPRLDYLLHHLRRIWPLTEWTIHVIYREWSLTLRQISHHLSSTYFLTLHLSPRPLSRSRDSASRASRQRPLPAGGWK